MGNAEVSQAHAPRSIEEKIEVEGPRPVARASRPAPRFALEPLQQSQQLERRKACFSDDDRVEEGGLTRSADARGPVETGETGVA